jgi:predicted N-acetyltransferase YhbS
MKIKHSTITGLTFFLWVPVQSVRLTSARILFLHGKPNFHGCHGYTNQPNLRIQTRAALLAVHMFSAWSRAVTRLIMSLRHGSLNIHSLPS